MEGNQNADHRTGRGAVKGEKFQVPRIKFQGSSSKDQVPRIKFQLERRSSNYQVSSNNIQMTTPDIKPPYDLEERTYEFALKTRLFLRDHVWHRVSWEDVRQLLRSSGSVAANYVEAREAISDADFIYRLRICRKETKESALWLSLLSDTNEVRADAEAILKSLFTETDELVRIFTASIRTKETSR
jgi:four helix bundle protein